MTDRRSMKLAGLVIGGAALLTAAVPTAFAANTTGGFSYGSIDAPDAAVTIKNPTIARCYPTKGAASTADNETGIDAQLFKDSSCKQLTATIAPGRSDNMAGFASVKFTNQAPLPVAPVPAAGTPAQP